MVNGEVDLGVNLDQARLEDIDPDAQTATLVLPKPKVRRARLNHERTTIYDLDRQGLWLLVLSDEASRKLVNKAMREAQAAVESAAENSRLVEQAQRRAEEVLRGTFEVIGWEVQALWAGTPSSG